MISRRVADNRLGSVKDDLLFALRRVQIDLDTYCVDPTEPAPLETMADALEQVRGPLAALEHREAVVLLDEMRAVVLDRMSGTIPSLDLAAFLAALRQATDRVTGYLEVCLSPGSRRPDADLAEAVETLRRTHPYAAPTGSSAQTAHLPEIAPAIYTLQDTLKRLQQTIAGPLEQAADQPESWEALRADLLDLRRMLADRDWTPTAFVLDRLDRIVEALAAGAAEHYGMLITGVCADILAGLGYCLEPLSNGDSAPAAVLDAAHEHLSQLETLLHLPTLAQISTAMSVASIRPGASAAPETGFSPLQMPEAPILEAIPLHPDTNMSEDVAGLVDLIGLTDADPEFIEVFLEEARGELAVIREQLAVWRQHLENHEALATLRRSFHTLKGSGRMVGAAVIGDFAWEFENLLNQVIGGSLPPSPAISAAIEAAADALAPLVGEVAPHANALAALAPLAARAQALLRTEPEVAAAPPAQWAIAPDIDPEFAEVFLEEARSELAAIQEQLAIWRQHLENREALTTLRRAFHTLKGSGRVVGATVIGDFAWRFESLLSQVLNGTIPATSALADLVGAAAAALEPLVSQTPATAEAALTPLTRLSAQVNALLCEQPIEAAPAALEPVEPVEPTEWIEIAPLPLPPPPPAEVEPVMERIPAVEALAMPDADMAQVFQYEATEILDSSDAILQQLGVNPDQPELLNDLRRGMHTLKGSSRMAGIMTIGDLAHAAESVLDALGKFGGRITPVVLDSLQHALDRLNRMLAEAASGTSPATATELIADLHSLADVVAAGEAAEALPSAALASIPAPAPAPAPAAMVAEPSSFRTMTELDQELAQVFQTEATEILDSSDIILQRLRGESDNADLLNNLRREMHTLKGSSRMAGFMMVGDLAHAAESVLDALGKGTVKASPSILDPVQRALDGLHQMLAGVVSGARPPARQELIEELQGLIGGKPAERPQVVAPSAPVAPMMVPATVAARPAEKNAASGEKCRRRARRQHSRQCCTAEYPGQPDG